MKFIITLPSHLPHIHSVILVPLVCHAVVEPVDLQVVVDVVQGLRAYEPDDHVDVLLLIHLECCWFLIFIR